VNNYTIKNCHIRNSFYFEAAGRVEGNYVKTRTNNRQIFHANGHEKKDEQVEEVINLIRMIVNRDKVHSFVRSFFVI